VLNQILPRLKEGVLIHFHDVLYPFEYPKEWVFQGRNWNEDYILRAFLLYNSKFEILLFSDYIHKHHKEAFVDMPLTYKNSGGNLWIEKKTKINSPAVYFARGTLLPVGTVFPLRGQVWLNE